MNQKNLSFKSKAEQILCPRHEMPILSLNIQANIPLGDRLVCGRCDTENYRILFPDKVDRLLEKWWQQELDLIQQCRCKFNGLQQIIKKLQEQLIKQLDNYLAVQKDKLRIFFDKQESQIKKYQNKLNELLVQRQNSELKKILDMTQQEQLSRTILQEIAIFFTNNLITGDESRYQDMVSFTDFNILIHRPLIEKIGWPLQQINSSLQNKLGLQNQMIQKFNDEFEQKIKDHLFQTKQQFKYNDRPSLLQLENKITSIANSVDDQMIAIGGDDGEINLYTSLINAPIQLHVPGKIQEIIFSTDNKYLAVTQFSEPFSILLFEINKNLQNNQTAAIILQGHNDIIWRIQFAQNSQFILSGSRDKTFKIWNTDTKSIIYQKMFDSVINCVSIAPNQKYISVCSGNGKVYIFDYKQQAKLQQKLEFQAHESNAYCTVFTQDSKILLTSQTDIKLWRLESLFTNRIKLPLQIFKGVSPIWSIKSEFIGNNIIAIDDNIKIWDAETSKLECEIILPENNFDYINTKNFVVFRNLQSILIGGKNAIQQFIRETQETQETREAPTNQQ